MGKALKGEGVDGKPIKEAKEENQRGGGGQGTQTLLDDKRVTHFKKDKE